MASESPLGLLSRASAPSLGVFRGRDALVLGVSRKQLMTLRASGVIERVYSDTYRMTAVPTSKEQSLRAALLWAGDAAAAAGKSAGQVYGLEGVRTNVPEIVVPPSSRVRSSLVTIHRANNRAPLLLRNWHGMRVTGAEPTLVALGAALDPEGFEIACEDARRRRLTSVPSLRAYLDRFGTAGRPGVAPLRTLLDHLDPVHPARSTLEVKTRRLLVASGLTDFVRELPLRWNGRTYLYDFGFEQRRTILETNGRRWHDDPSDYEYDNEKWSVPGRYGYRVVLATWDKVTRRPHDLVSELTATLAAQFPTTSRTPSPAARWPGIAQYMT